MLSCSDLTIAIVAAALRRREVLPQILEPGGDVGLVHRLQEAIERRLREEQSQEQPEEAIETRCPDLFGRLTLIPGGAAHAGGDTAHFDAAPVQPLEARPRIVRQPREHGDDGLGRRRRVRGGAGRCRRRVDLRVDGRAESRDGDEAGEIEHFASRDDRQERG